MCHIHAKMKKIRKAGNTFHCTVWHCKSLHLDFLILPVYFSHAECSDTCIIRI